VLEAYLGQRPAIASKTANPKTEKLFSLFQNLKAKIVSFDLKFKI
jgi:hypothetical protein